MENEKLAIFSNDLKNSVNFFFKIALIGACQSFNISFIINTIKVCVLFLKEQNRIFLCLFKGYL